jgi:hypothetical protein
LSELFTMSMILLAAAKLHAPDKQTLARRDTGSH